MNDYTPPIVVFAPLASDAAALSAVIAGKGLKPEVCVDGGAFGAGLLKRPVCAIISEEAAGPATLALIEQFLSTEPSWSSLPLIFVLSDPERPPIGCQRLRERYPAAAIVLLQRPVRPATLSSVLDTQFALRRRQFETGDLLARLEAAEADQRLMVGEMRHRTGNILSLMNAIVRLTLRRATTVKEVGEALESRLQALSRAHHQMGQSDDHALALDEMLTDLVGPYAPSNRLVLSGPRVVIRGRLAFDFALIVNELATNAAKYGALSSETGSVHVTWTDDADGLSLRWEERGGPTVAAPDGQSFGTRLIDGLSQRHDARTAFDFQPSGLVWTFELPPETGTEA